MRQKEVIEISGTNPIKNASHLLKGYDSENVEAIEIKIHKKSNSQKEDKQKNEVNMGDKSDKKKNRVKGSIRPNTSHHAVLQTLQSIGGPDEYVPGKKVLNTVTGVSESSVFPALTQLWERKLAERERDGNGSYAYRVSEYGEKKLEELGEPNINE
ncbi:hypothetical protein [Halohasta litorea]|uniref:Transcriptional regulator PadR-like family protein n=1 Tax=Halohasta litorea TaxID=869891 RepID=A0ABD6D3D7_9EURY|nr:hypothetical protein [Halohasta litorea]